METEAERKRINRKVKQLAPTRAEIAAIPSALVAVGMKRYMQIKADIVADKVDCVMFWINWNMSAKCTALKKLYCLLEDKPCVFRKPRGVGVGETKETTETTGGNHG